MTRNLLLLAALLLPAACANAPSMEEMAASCEAAGYASGTEGGMACLSMSMQQEAARQETVAARRAIAAMMLGSMGQRMSAGPQAYAQPQMRMRTSCLPMGNGFTCQ
jgi:hypothetical protein